MEIKELQGLKKLLDSKEKMLKGEVVVSVANEVARNLLNQYYSKGPIFPVDIRGLVDFMKIDIYESNLNVDRGFRIEKVNGYLRKNLDGKYAINIQNSDSEFVKRYILSHELSHYLLDCGGSTGSESNPCGQKCIDPLFAKDWDEMFSDMLAAFILFPPELVLEHLQMYTDQMRKLNRYPLDASEWLRELGQCAQVSYYFTIVSYQSIKFYMCYLYNHNKDDEIIRKYIDFFK